MAKILAGRTLSFTDDPEVAGSGAVVFHERGAVVVGEDGLIVWAGARADLPMAYQADPVEDFGASILSAGFIDPHIHFPQYRMLAAPGRDLLDWLERFTFPEEARFSDLSVAEASAEIFLDRLIANGTTTALAFSSVHEGATDALFAAAERRTMAFATGKTMMDRNADPRVLDSAHSGHVATCDLISKWHLRGRLSYAISPRFAITSTEAQLKGSGELLAAHPTCLMQTHLSESLREIETVKALFPNIADYTGVYEHFGLLGPTSLFAHGIHLSESECRRLSESGSSITHCPTSNTFLGSGLFDLGHAGKADRPVAFGLATDIGAGTSFSLLATMGEAMKVAKLNGRQLSATRAFYLATLGNARIMHMAGNIGSLAPGKHADIVVLDPTATPVLAARDELSETLEDRLFALACLGDERAVQAVYVAGKRVGVAG